MKKRKVRLLAVTAMLGVSLLYGCGGKEAKAPNATDVKVEESSEGNTQQEEKRFTVTFCDADGEAVLSTVEVADGALVEEYTPEKDGQMFMGWFATPSLTHQFDFSQPITADTKVFAGFMENVEDTRTFAIMGSGKSPLLSTSSWGKTIEDAHYMTKNEGENVYTITLDICEGDEFQFAVDSAWSNQRGGGYMTHTEADGKEYFTVAGGLVEGSQKSNIKCAISGNYTLTLSTYPGADVYDTENSYYTEETRENYNSNPFDKIDWTYNGEMTSGEVALVTTYYIKGAKVTNWEDQYDEEYAFTETDGVHTLTIALEEGDEFLFTSLVTVDGNSSTGNEYVRYSNVKDETSLSYIEGTESYNMVAKEAGTYTFTYHPDTEELTVEFTQ
ncbi:hypothetical protein IMSAGC011_01892 [Lachnospiraceae bacterium]|nr:hypothetical protein IMSAGC011_01892 [Lachnospiraceae bacterium]